MSDNVEFKGDVAQAVMGDVNEAPRLSNVVTLNIGDKKEIAFITDYQRRRINALVKELAALTGDDQMAIYKIIIADFGLMKIKELPIERYLEVKILLEKWITAARGPDNIGNANPAADCKPHAHQSSMPCLACVEKERSYARLQRTSRAQVAGLIMLMAVCGWLLYKLPNEYDLDATRNENVCYIDGKSHSIGSKVKTSSGLIEECIASTSTASATWVAAKRNR